MILLDGKVVSQKIKEELKSEIAHIKNSGKRVPHLAAILVGHDGASETYVASKVRNCTEVGFDSSLIRLSADVRENELVARIKEVNENPLIDGLIVQLPLPTHIQVEKITESIAPGKDVDGFHPLNAGRMALNQPCYIPATPYGILLLLEHYKINTSGKHCVVLGRSHIVGRPMSILMSRNTSPGNCTVTLCHRKTPNLIEFTRNADILIAALGKPEFVTGNMIKKDAVVIDVGITRIADHTKKSGFRIAGDVEFESAAKVAGYLSPVPGGVGLMTIIGLLKNTLKASTGEVTF